MLGLHILHGWASLKFRMFCVEVHLIFPVAFVWRRVDSDYQRRAYEVLGLWSDRMIKRSLLYVYHRKRLCIVGIKLSIEPSCLEIAKLFATHSKVES